MPRPGEQIARLGAKMAAGSGEEMPPHGAGEKMEHGVGAEMAHGGGEAMTRLGERVASAGGDEMSAAGEAMAYLAGGETAAARPSMARVVVEVLSEALDPAPWLAALETGRAGAVASFVGLCRDEGGRLAALELEHYPGMAEAEILRIAEEACARWPVLSLTAVHRSGVVPAGAPIVLVAATSSHRDAAFDSVRFVMDFLKTDAPFWKREHLADGTHGPWIEAASKDDAARARWAGAAP